MANHISHAMPFIVRGARATIQVPYLNTSGAPTDPTTPDTEISIDGGAFADTTEEVTVITGSNGGAYITLTAVETAASMIMIAAKAASGPATTLLTFYPRNFAVLFSGTATAGAAGSITLPTSVNRIPQSIIGCLVKTTGGTGGGTTGNQVRKITAFSSAGVATVSPNWEVTVDNTTTFEVLLTEEAQLAWVQVAMLEPSTVPGFTSPVGQQLMWLFALARNRITQTATTQALRNDANGADIATAAVADDGTTFSRGEWA